MSLQIFKRPISNDIFFELLNKICLKNDKFYELNYESFKKGMYLDLIPIFFKFCYPYYHIAKRIYLKKEITYNSFTTVIRQICNFNKIKYTSQIKYDKDDYDILYYIFF